MNTILKLLTYMDDWWKHTFHPYATELKETRIEASRAKPTPTGKGCPFFGFANLNGMMIGPEGNSCALHRLHSPCPSQNQNSWCNCTYVTSGQRDDLIRTIYNSTAVVVLRGDMKDAFPDAGTTIPIKLWIETVFPWTIPEDLR